MIDEQRPAHAGRFAARQSYYPFVSKVRDVVGDGARLVVSVSGRDILVVPVVGPLTLVAIVLVVVGVSSTFALESLIFSSVST